MKRRRKKPTEPRGTDREAARGAAGSFLMAALAVIAWGLTSTALGNRFVTVPDVVRRWLALSALGAVLGALLMAAVGAFLVSFGELVVDVEPLIKRLRQRDPVTWRAIPRALPTHRSSRTGLGQVGRQLSILVHQLRNQVKRSAVALARQTVNGLVAFLNAGQRALCRLANWLHRWARRRSASDGPGIARRGGADGPTPPLPLPSWVPSGLRRPRWPSHRKRRERSASAASAKLAGRARRHRGTARPARIGRRGRGGSHGGRGRLADSSHRCGHRRERV